MASNQRITEADLRGFMRDPRYWQSGHPEREAYGGWVTQGWRVLGDADGIGKGGAVWVKPYSRVRDGQTEQVAGHWRSPPPSSAGEEQDNIVLAARRRQPPHEQPTILEGGPAAQGGARPTRRESIEIFPIGTPAPRAGARSPEELLRNSVRERVTSGNTDIRMVDGGLRQLSADFHAMTAGRPTTTYSNGLMRGTTPDGRAVVARPSRSGEATIEIQRGERPDIRTTHEFRYDWSTQ